MANTYDIGDVVRWSVAFTDSDGTAVDPTAVTFKYQDPSGTETSIAAVNDAVGAYHYDVTIDEAGVWHGRFEGTGSNVAAAESYVAVRRSEFY